MYKSNRPPRNSSWIFLDITYKPILLIFAIDEKWINRTPQQRTQCIIALLVLEKKIHPLLDCVKRRMIGLAFLQYFLSYINLPSQIVGFTFIYDSWLYCVKIKVGFKVLPIWYFRFRFIAIHIIKIDGLIDVDVI